MNEPLELGRPGVLPLCHPGIVQGDPRFFLEFFESVYGVGAHVGADYQRWRPLQALSLWALPDPGGGIESGHG
ncbi:MAG: hypothetical protein QHJ82_13310 [Verrucomicrobiota bacterium]|nr:hypothetical protein [Verrucomicrobiota bacterium]